MADGATAGADFVRARLRARDTIWMNNGPIAFHGRVVVRPGAEIGEAIPGWGCEFEAGRITTIGSRSSRRTMVEAGAKLILRGVPAQDARRDEDWDVEILGPCGPLGEEPEPGSEPAPAEAPAVDDTMAAAMADPDALRDERKRLRARIAEIDAALAEAEAPR